MSKAPPKPSLGHGLALALTVMAFFFVSTAGVVTRHLTIQAPFEITFWRSAFAAVTLGLVWLTQHTLGQGATVPWRSRLLWLSAACWAVMFTAFMVALMLTSVANALVTLALGPVITAFVSWLVFGRRLAWPTWLAMVLAGLGVLWMFGHALQLQDQHAVAGILVALCVPVAAAIQWNVLHQSQQAQTHHTPMLPSVLVGAALSALVTLPLALPLQAHTNDIAAMAALGAFQLALPCALLVWVAKALSATEIGLLALLELVFGIGLTWLGAGEAPTAHAMIGGALVVAALVLQQLSPQAKPA